MILVKIIVIRMFVKIKVFCYIVNFLFLDMLFFEFVVVLFNLFMEDLLFCLLKCLNICIDRGFVE